MKKYYVNVRFFVTESNELAHKEYFFQAYEPLNEGDLVVVDTRYGFSLAVVSSFPAIKPDFLSDGNLKEVVAKVNTTAFEVRQREAARVIELKKQMDQRIKSMEKINMYRLYAEKDADLKAMLDEYLKLTE